MQHTIQTLPLLFSYLPFSPVFVKREREAKRREMRFKGSSWDVLVRPSVVEGYRIRPTIRKSYLHFNMSYNEREETRVSCARRERGGRGLLEWRTTAIPGYKVIRSLNSWLDKIFMEFSWTVMAICIKKPRLEITFPSSPSFATIRLTNK